jgi:hypothetical protein
MNMKRFLLGAFLLVLSGAAARADDAAAISSGRAAAKAWLARVDAGEYASSWDEASSAMRAAVTKAEWEKGLRSARGPLGKVASRAEHSASFTRSLPGAPEGEYVVLLFDTSFEGRAGTAETVTAMLEKDGVWRIAGYFIH